MSAPYLDQEDNGYWYIKWTDGRRSKRVSTRSKNLDGEGGAKAFFAEWLKLEQRAADEQADPSKSVHTIGELWDKYKAGHIDRNVSAPKTAAQSWKNLEPHFANMTPAAVTDDDATAYGDKRRVGVIGKPSKSGTIRRELVVLRACLRWCAAKEQKIIASSAVPSFNLPPEGDPRDRWLRTEEVQRIMDAAASSRGDKRLSRVERFLWLALETSARKSAILRLTWDRVDFETMAIDFNEPGRRRTKKRRAVVPISKALLPVLVTAYTERLNDTDLVLDNSAEIWASMQTVLKAAGYRPANTERAKLPRKPRSKPLGTGVSPNTFRHTAATHMARRGAYLWKIAKVLGNSSAMVEKVYAKHCPDDLRDTVNTISPWAATRLVGPDKADGGAQS